MASKDSREQIRGLYKKLDVDATFQKWQSVDLILEHRVKVSSGDESIVTQEKLGGSEGCRDSGHQENHWSHPTQ